MGELRADGRRHGEQRNHHDQPHDAHHHHYGQSNHTDEQQIEPLHGNIADLGKSLVKGDGQQFLVEKTHDGQDNEIQDQHNEQVARWHCQDTAKEIAHQIGFVPLGQINQDDAQGHADGPHDADDGVGALPRLALYPSHAQRGGQAKANGPQNWAEPQEIPQTDAAIGRVRDAPTDKDDTIGNHIGADDAAGDADEQPG